ncbi:MAG: hypothetical protein Q8M09_15020 [Pseudomonadota bacterium]|nr:hypothetical protein [Pseudomonadota bacterium]MDP1905536.1 hypothetical protein [Pseudomonadota bacterium]MDP2352914.1 hypothetical protein [Pseudomonadota bacterium]
MFKRTAVVVILLSISGLAAAQQPAAVWPWLPMQIWAVPANAQAMPFPTPFWLWVVPPAAQPSASPPARPETTAEPVTQPAPPAAAAPPITAPVLAVPEKAVPPLDESIAVTPAPAPAPVVVATEVAKEVVTEVVAEVAKEPAAAKVAPPPIRMAPVAKAKVKSTPKASTQKARKLCFKDGKLDICQ